MSAEFTTSAAAMELGEVMGMQGLDFTVPSSSPRRGSSFTQAAAAATNAASYPSPFLDEQKMLRFSKATAAAQTQPVSGLDLRRPNEPAFVVARNRRPFTPSQWMELEHQALIYKYLNAKAPIPSSRPDAGGWRPLYLYTSAESDPEPGRCRRTDGKKWRCSKEAITDHKYCERHINRNRHRSRKPVENQPRKTSKEAPAGSLKKAKVDDLKQATVSYWTDSLNRTMLSRDKANKQTDDNNATLLNSASRQPTLSLLSQLKQQDKTDTFGTTTVDRESITADTAQNDWCSNNQQSNRNMPSTQLHDADCLQSVLQKFSLANNEMEPQRKRYPDSMLASSTFYSSEGTHTTFLPANITQVQEDCISSSWEMPRGGPLGEILTDSKVNQGQAKKCEPKSYGWLWNFDHAT